MKAKKHWFVVGGVSLLLAVSLCLLVWEQTMEMGQSVVTKNRSKVAPSNQELDQSRVEAGKAGNLKSKKNETKVYFDNSFAALERICPALSESEEDMLLKNSGRSVDVLGALALLQSKRSEEFVDEALAKNPTHLPSLWAAAFSVQNPKKRVGQAELLCKLDPDNMAPYVAAAALNSRLNKTEKVLQYLKGASSQKEFVDRTTRWESLIAKQYTDAGRSSQQTDARMTLQRSQVEAAALMQIAKSPQGAWNFREASDEAIQQKMMILAIYQQLGDSANFDLTSRSVALGQEFAALTAIHETSSSLDVSNFFSMPIESALMQSEKHLIELRELDALRTKSPEVYERLSPEDRGLVLQLSKQKGQVAGLRWIWENRPEALNPAQN